MASDTAPAAPGPAPSDGPHTAGAPNAPGAPARPAGGWLASALQPVDPARPTFDLTPTTALPGSPNDPGQGGTGPSLTSGTSSAAYHDGTPGTAGAAGDGKTSTNSSQERGIVRAWLLAGAERWRKGADARNKALDIQKAKATALQVKEARTVNRSEKIIGGSTSTGTSSQTGKNDKSGKNDSTKTDANKRDTGSKNTTTKNGSSGHGGGASGGGRKTDSNGKGNTQAGQDKAAHRQGPGIRAAARDRAADRVRNGPQPKNDKQAAHREGPGIRSAARDRAADRIRNGPRGKTDRGASGVGTDRTGGSGGGGKTDKTSKNTNGNGGKDPKPQTTTTTCGDASGISMTKDKKPKDNSPAGKDTPAKTEKTPSAKDAPAVTGNGKTPAPGGGAPVGLDKKNPDTKGGTKPADLTKKTPTTTADQTAQPQPTPRGPAIDTQASREAGYRDGTRAGKAVAHAGAYKDGVKDGYRDTKEAAGRDKARLDNAHTARKQPQTAGTAVPPRPTVPPKPTTPPPAPAPRTVLTKPKEQPVPAPAPASSADYHPPQAEPTTPATPLGVSKVTGTHVVLDNNQVISRGEVRNLKDYERRIEEKGHLMNRMADAAKALQGHAEEQNKKVTDRLEQARGKETGGDLIGDMVKLQEKTAVQARQAAELHKRAIRAAEATTVLLANVSTRYGGIYMAVCNSPLTKPAELDFYDDRTTSDA